MTGTASVTSLLIRTNRIRLAVWTVAIPALLAFGALSVKALYPTVADRESYAAMAQLVTAQIAFNGPPAALTTLGGIVVFEAGWLLMLAVAVCSILIGVRVTRGQEETGTLELLRSGRVSRGATLLAAALVLGSLLAVIAVASGAALIATGTAITGALIYAAALFCVGVFFGAVAVSAAQVTAQSRAAYGLAFAVLGTSFAFRAAGDAGGNTLSWLSPLGWAQASEPFGANNLWPLLLLLAAAIGIAGGAWMLNQRRDLGAGVIAPRPGRVSASALASSPLGLQLRLARATILAWSAGIAIMMVAFGSMATTAEDFAASSDGTAEVIAAFGGTSLTDAFLVFSILVLAILSAGCALSLTMRVRADEDSGRIAVLATAPVRRTTIFAGYLLSALSAALLLLAFGSLMLGVGYAVGTGDWTIVGGVVGSALAHFPAIVALAAAALALAAIRPESASVAWAVYAVTATIALLGPAFSLPGWVANLSVFEHVPEYPSLAWPLTIGGLGCLLVAVALGVFERRDLRT
ncbi:ABC transporter permease [Hoyosella subflava]|uniref:BH1004 protein n=1 Tax=Hoyosella subflava (strain DSM 45089 / JCM 17490 / NBRC 109087 / DQS3-9A1) TaxID=443218 RepID=F6EQ34_HOYSD|nr:hypothetical protein [Hoyosella subflava]AEF41855.1 BH1004 protein [Hoyosella subflava DQS3-9A1]